MKRSRAAFLLPAGVLVAASLGLAYQLRAVGRADRENATLAAALAALSDGKSSGSPGSDAFARDPPLPRDGGKPDWARFGHRYMDLITSGRRDRAQLALKRLLARMTTGELAASLEEIEGLDLSSRERQPLEFQIAGALTERDPRMFVERFVSLADVPPPSIPAIQYRQALRNWADRDPAAFLAWMDARAAAGGFQRRSLDGKNALQTGCETAMMHTLLGAGDSTAATARLRELPFAERQAVLVSMAADVKPGSEGAAAQAIRATTRESEQPVLLAELAGGMVGKSGLPGVSVFMEQSAVSAPERRAIVAAVVDTAMRGDIDTITPKIDEIYAWAADASPATAASATGRAIGNLSSLGDFAQAAGLAAGLRDRTGDDGFLTAFFANPSAARKAQENPGEALAVLARIGDPDERERLRTALHLPDSP